MIADLGWTTLERRLSLLYRILEGKTLLAATNYVGRHDHHRKLWRAGETSTAAANTFFPKTIRDWNSLEASVVNIGSDRGFSAALLNREEKMTCSHSWS